ncbi:MAG: GNAT family N-acetyltransferase, partial [Cohaesibacteraceae bacterium]
AFIKEALPRLRVLTSEDWVLGFVSPDAQSGEISDLWIDPEHQRLGLGAVLLAAGEAQLKANGRQSTWLTTHAQNAGALRFYRTQGYSLLDLRDAQGQTLPDVTYSRALLGKQLSRPDAVSAETMSDVRNGIDTLDPMIVSILAERFAFIDRAAKLKPKIGMPAHVSDRIEEVVGNARKQAEKLRFDPDLTEAFWRNMVDLAVQREEAHMSSKSAQSFVDQTRELAS